jgi:hypothetical protein
MIRMGKGTGLTPSEVFDKAEAFFGPGGFGLEVEERDDCCIRFVGAGGYVSVAVPEVEAPGEREVIVEGREWENQIRQFMAEI